MPRRHCVDKSYAFCKRNILLCFLTIVWQESFYSHTSKKIFYGFNLLSIALFEKPRFQDLGLLNIRCFNVAEWNGLLR